MSSKEDRARRRNRLAILARLMAEPEGRGYFYDFLASTHVYATSFATNALSMAFREGERSVGLRLGADLEEANPEGFLLMLKEAKDERSNPNRTGRADPFADTRDDPGSDDS